MMDTVDANSQLCSLSLSPTVTTLPASIMLLLFAPVRIFRLTRQPVKLSLGRLGRAKLVFSSLSFLLKLAQVDGFHHGGLRSGVEVLAFGAGASLTASALYIWLSVVEHRCCVRPSTAAAVYLLLGLCGNAVRGVGVSSSRHFGTVSSDTILWCDMFAQLLLLVLESQSKAKYVLAPYMKASSPEDTAGLISRTFWWWLTDLLVVGQRRVLSIDDMPQLSESLRPSTQRTEVLKAWEARAAKSGDAYTLLRVVPGSSARSLLSPVLPRLFLVVFKCSQPIIIGRAIAFVQGRSREGVTDQCDAYVIFCAALIVYFGLAISSSMYTHQLNKLNTLTRTALINLVYEKALSLSHHGSDAGRMVTILSTDIDSAADIGRLLHGSWGQAAELAIGLVLLAKEVGWLFPVPLITIFFASRVSRFVAQNVRSRTKGWSDSTQARISALSSILGSMRSVKAMGLSAAMSKYVNDLRDTEIESSKHVRWMQVAYNAGANANGIFTPVITVVLYSLLAASRGESLDVKTAFTTVAILSLVTHPANMIMTIVPRIVGIMGNVDRVQAFLLEPPRVDCRKTVAGTESRMGISLRNVTTKYKTSTNTGPNLRNISLELPKHSVTICAGPTGCGKSTLAKTILGEVAPTQGLVTVSSSRIAYCDQRAWIPSGTIREVVCAFTDKVDEVLYEEALRTCCLDYDLQRLPEGDETIVGSRGANLSGGQRQRLALARMVYSRAAIAVLDDPFSALDGTTESQVAENLLGKNGWFRRAKVTAFIITNAAQHFHYADQVVILENGQVAAQGGWRMLEGRSSELQKFNFREQDASPTTGPADEAINNTSKRTEHDVEKDLHRRVGDMTLYSHYIRSVGVWNFLLLATCTALYAFFNSFSTYWFKLWTESDGTHAPFYILGYALLALTAWAATSANLWSTFILLAPRSGRLLHQALLETTVAAPLRYFSSTDGGVILNRFSKDISLVDRQLPSALSALCTQIFKMLVQVVLLMQVQRPLLFALPFCVVVVYLVQKLYLRTSRQLRVLELESYSSLNSWFLETAEGIVSIRAFDWTRSATSRNLANLETSIRPAYSLVLLQCWLNLVLDLLVSCFAVGIIAIAATWSSETSAANIGVSLNLILVANSTLVRLVESFTQLEVSLGAIARLREVEAQTPREDKPWEDQIPAGMWPEKGCLTLRHYNAGYDDEHKVLTDINLSVDGGKKLVICGRTGSGKSTIILGLLRLIESSGEVEIDGHALSRIPRTTIRDRAFITVPQEPFSLPGAAIRFNLDPSSLATEDMLREALQAVNMWDAVCGTSSGNDADPLSQPASCLQALSVGQLQLISMARAIVKKNVMNQGLGYADDDENPSLSRPILVLDEATSSLDTATEAAIHDIIETEFIAAGYTVVIVAHRISVLARTMRPGLDKVAWLQDGRVVKVGNFEEIVEFTASETGGV